MQAPEPSQSSSSPSADSPGSSRDDRPSQRVVLVVGTALLVAGTTLALLQPTRVEPLRDSEWTTLDWWRYPVERNAIQRLPISRGPLLAVYAARGTSEVWFAGAGGLVIHSTNGGRTWASQTLSATTQTQEPPPASSRKASLTIPRTRRTTPLLPVSLASFRVPQQGAQQAVQQGPLQQKPSATRVPSVVGLPIDSAVNLLARIGVKAMLSDSVVAKAPPGIVIAQNPPAGTPVSPATLVRLVRSSSKPAPDPSGSPSQSLPKPDVPSAKPAASGTFYPTFSAVCFTTSRVGWMVGDQGAAFRSTDGGANWSQVVTGTTSDLLTVGCDDQLGAVAAGTGDVVLFRPGRDAGELRSATVMTDLAISGGGTILWAQRNSTFASPVRSMVSRDTGRTWLTDDKAIPAGARLVAFSDAANGFLVDSSNRARRTNDGGSTWLSPTACPFGGAAASTSPLTTIVGASVQRGLAVDEQNRVWVTSDGWATCDSPAAFRSSAARVSAASNAVWYAADGGGLRSSDGGRTWHALISTSRFASLAFSDTLNGVVGLDHGTIGTTSDGGRSWSFARLDSLEGATPRFLTPRSTQDIFAATDTLVRRFSPTRVSGRYQWHGGSGYRSTNGGRSWTRYDTRDSILVLVFTDAKTGWGVGRASTYVTRDNGLTWTDAPATGVLGVLNDQSLRSVSFLRDRGAVSRAWVTRDDNVLLSFDGTRWDTLSTGVLAASPVSASLAYGLDTLGNLIRASDGGRRWSAVPPAAPRKYPAPWFYAFAAATVAGTLATSRRRRPEESTVEDSIADILVSDRPLREGDRDVLDFGKIAAGLSRFIRNSRTAPPLTIAVTGPWGTGKSSLMQLLRRDLERRRFRTIWFNAWHHQREESLLASLLESIRLTATPPVWTPKGVRFRFRLLGRRIARYSAPALALLPVFALAVGYILKDPATRWHDLTGTFASLVSLFSQSSAAAGEAAAAAHGSTDLSQHKTVFALIISIVGTVLTYLKGFKAFGVKPEVVAKSVVAAGKVRTIEAQPAFRYRFAQDFAEVTSALRPERLVIFVDDLDRCKPEQVLEILEAINFLAESGECVVVIGIDRERVTGCVAIGFKEVATVLAKTLETPVGTAPRPDIGASRARTTKTDVEYQIEYARHYLEKLLNMEVPIPPATAEGLGDVMANAAPARTASDVVTPEDDADVRTRRRRRARRQLYATAVAALSVTTFLVGWNGSGWLDRLFATSTVSPTPPIAAVTQAGSVGPVVAPPGTVNDSTSPASTREKDRHTPAIFSTGTPTTTAWWLHALLAATALATLLWLVTPQEDNRVDDSPAFAAALKAWAPVLFEEHRTPRSAKKFLNKMRFLSMAQRAPAERHAPVEVAFWKLRSLPWFRQFAGAFEIRTETHETLLPGSIPEVALVSLNVIRDRYPEWLSDPEFWRADLRQYVAKRVTPVPADIAQALDGLDTITGAGGTTPQSFAWYRDAWTRLEVWIRDDP